MSGRPLCKKEPLLYVATEGVLYVIRKAGRDGLFLLPVVPDVLHVVIIFHDVDELFHQGDVLLGFQLLIVLGNHLDLCGNEGKNRGSLNFLIQCHALRYS